MAAVVPLLLMMLTLAAAGPTAAQESTEPPVPKSSPVRPVVAEELPRAGGIMVFGGTQGLGLEVVKHLVARHERVTVVARATSDTTALKALEVSLVAGDALDPESLKQAFTTAPFRAVISTLGGRKGDYRVDVEGNKNVVDAAKNAGVTRLILVTAIGAGDSGDATPWYIRWFMTDYMAAKTQAEDYLRATDLDYTIVRPGLLLNSTKSGETALVAGTSRFSGITRTDLGALVAASVEDKSTFKRAFTALDIKRNSLWSVLTY